MFLTKLREFQEYINSYLITQFEQNGDNLRFRMMITFKDTSKLYIKEIMVDGTKRKYGYQWLDQNDNLICRWDNAPDWPEIPTFPHHKHFQTEDNVLPSENIEFSAILREIIQMMDEKNRN